MKSTSNPRIVILDDYQEVALKTADWSGVRVHASIDIVTHHIESEDELVEVLHDAKIVVAMRERTRIDASLIDRLPHLELIVTTGPVNAAIDIKHAWERGIFVCGTGGYVSPTTELTIGLILAVARSIVQESTSVASGGWQTQLGIELAGKTLGLVGLGRIGSDVATIGQALGMNVMAWSPNLNPEVAAAKGVRAVPKDELFRTSDVVSVHLVLSDRSRGIVGGKELESMKQTAFIVNTSRGPIVDEAALVMALQTGKIGGAGIDVFDDEPLGQDHPLRELARTHPRVVLTPHIGYVTDGLYGQFFAEVVEDIEAWFEGRVIRVVS